VNIIKRKIPVLILMLVFTLSLMLMIPGMLMAQEDEVEAEGEEEVVEPEPDPEPETLEFDVKFPEIQGELGELFEFNFTVTYNTGDEPFGLEEDESAKTFDIAVEFPSTWFAATTPQYQEEIEIVAVKLTSGTSETLRVVATPLVDLDPGEYDIKVTLSSSVEDDELEGTVELKAIITSTYGMDLKTKSGRLSTDVTSGQDNHYKLILENTGSANLEKVKITSSEPDGWTIDFDTEEIEVLEAGEEVEIDANIKPADDTIAGDYMVSLSASADNAEDDLELRITVETPTIWGIVGIAIIVVVIVAVAIVFARLGRR
jgi:uncharacterized membrane protein